MQHTHCHTCFGTRFAAQLVAVGMLTLSVRADVPYTVHPDDRMLGDLELLVSLETAGRWHNGGILFWVGAAAAVPFTGNTPAIGPELALEYRGYLVHRWESHGPFLGVYTGMALMVVEEGYRGTTIGHTLTCGFTQGVKGGWKIAPRARLGRLPRRGPVLEPYMSAANTLYVGCNGPGRPPFPVITLGLRAVWEWVRVRRIRRARDRLPPELRPIEVPMAK